ncbi:Protein lin-54-like protein [Frankliniella fusca]|uniref:Protein lin-54-like protein n=1 Tax=Frankliniella fusca TaxID=407009 RepID=A0AAE1HAJ2_9NEOP|nr:Protein lin-54-like protein [Frankliniella fusca]
MEGTRPYLQTATLPLPFVNLSPSDPSTIFTSLLFAAEQASRQGQKFCAVTFDQPLFWKAAEIVLASPANSPLQKIIVRLGGFHLLMSFMGCIGHLMSGSGLEDLWATVFAKNSVQHMCSGKAYSRAVRAHFLTQAAILSFVLNQVFDSPDIERTRRKLLEICRKLYRGEHLAQDDTDILTQALREMDGALHGLKERGRTARLWVQYARQVELIRLLLRAERVGDWDLHLYAVREMLPYFHAAGHLNYAKSAQLYLQLMVTAESSLPPEERDQLFGGAFTVRKQDKLWAGNFSDQTIEMDYMRLLKCIGGITMHGRGITESTVAVWVKSMPFTLEVIRALENFCGLSVTSSYQHADVRDARISLDAEHKEKFKNWLEQHNPFDKPADQLVCLSSGLVADTTVNCDSAYEIGCRSMQKYVGTPFSEITLHRKDKAVPISAMTRSISVRGASVQVNPTQLFHRIIIAQKDVSHLEQHFAYELAPFPTSLFDENGMRKTAKSKLVDAVETMFAPSDDVIPLDSKYVLDGGYLLRKVVWPRPATYGDIVSLYSNYVTQHYGENATVVFDGYSDGPTTKDQEHALRAAAGTSADVTALTPAMTVLENQSKFLSNSKNKQQLIKLVTTALQHAGVGVLQAKADADRLVVVTAMDAARNGRNCIVVGNDTDLLVLLVGLYENGLPLHFLIPASGRTPLKVHHIERIHAAMGNTASHILLAHPISGTDTVSSMYRGSKKKALQKICNLSNEAEVKTFLTPGQSQDAVASACETLLLSLYGCSSISTLNQARYFLYKRTIARQSVRAKFELASLPPTTEAARQHSLRTYLQVQEWLGHELNPVEWGWKVENNRFCPVTTLKSPAPTELLELISCNCKSGCVSGCSCVNAMLKCSSICGHCGGVSCSNAESATGSGDEEEGEEDVDDPDDPSGVLL